MIEQKDTIIKLLTVLFPNAKIYLFGSRARGTHQPGSDIDLAIDDNREISHYDLAEAKSVVEGLRMPYTVDIVDMNSIPEKLKKIILTEGVVWKN